MKSFAFEEEVLLVENSVGEVEANPLERGQPDLDGQQIVIASRRFIAQPAFDDGKNHILLLPFEKCCSKLSKEFSARGFQDVQVTRIIYVIAEGAFGVSDAVGILKGHSK